MDLGQYIKRVLRWWWLLVLCTGIAAAASYYVSSRQTPVYQTTTTLMVGQVIHKANPTGQDFLTVEQLAESYAQMAARQPILQAAVDSLGLNTNWQELKQRVNAYSIERTQLLAITVQDSRPERAAALANEIAHQLMLQSPTSPENTMRQERSQFVQSQLDDLEVRIQTAQTRVEGLQAELDTAVSARQIQDLETEKADLEALINDWQANYADLLNFLQGGDSSNYLTIIEPAPLPAVPVSPNVRINVLLAAVAGLALAVSAALLLEYIDDTVKSPEEFGASWGLTPLGSVDRVRGRDFRGKLVVSHSSFSPLSEAYRVIRTNIQFTAVDQPAKTILITSPDAGEGKSITVANLGVIMAQAELRTVVVDADLRRPVLHKIFQIPNQTGLTDLLRLPGSEIDDQMQDTGVDNLKVITSGPLPPNSSELLGSQRMAELMKRLREKADVVLFDSPPVLAVTDAVVLAGRADGVVLVTEAGRTRREATKQAVERLRQVGANLLGGVLNRVPRSGRGYYYHYPYYARSGDGEPATPQAEQTMQRRWWQRLHASGREST
jgi:succinoglycan biosynthesis transport protein ExoP